MGFKIVPTTIFIKKIKKLKKKYPRILADLDTLVSTLEKDPRKGIHIGKSLYKIRLKSSDLNKGKSGSFRVIYYVVFEDGTVYLLTIYFKGKRGNIAWKEIEELLKELEREAVNGER
ncbi:hypothetical protein Dester_1369 [Desulfurobacterium thermolithotrophum DSM 11699]|uniref:Addiction module toxin, RelE/StbE family n=1 Tax=Desulfurobacterium thermolithotrophum (strain DSM 11699 / BSA) TaxID=868864 RepID=F0S1J7_DESTD|nr:hypothetical protein [Desulfurobacterium thermolithotrophum]ADY74000.1 hypothetical protein Dester_1369 [Desulfurobacterium thermolithotrophum DSM 11699]